MNIFKELCEYINTFNDGEYIDRKYLTAIFKHNIATVDTYRKGLQDLDYLETVYPGKYRKLLDIPDYINPSNYRNKELIERKIIQSKLNIL